MKFGSGPYTANRHHYRGKAIPRPWVYVGRGTPLGNPFTKSAYGEEALELYRRWLWSKIKRKDSRVLQALRSITPDTILVCSCKPKPCHADVIVSAWQWVTRTERQDEPGRVR